MNPDLRPGLSYLFRHCQKCPEVAVKLRRLQSYVLCGRSTPKLRELHVSRVRALLSHGICDNSILPELLMLS